jgi:hypothetical protein
MDIAVIDLPAFMAAVRRSAAGEFGHAPIIAGLRGCVQTAARYSGSPSGNNHMGARCRIRNGAVTSAVLVHLRVEPAHFDWRWRERPALALLAWEALARDPLARLRRIQVESTGTTINFRPAAITHRDIAASALLIASRLALDGGRGCVLARKGNRAALGNR